MPTLSQIIDWDVGHLEMAASDWTTTATQWEDHFDTLHRQAMSPGGAAWEGRGADAAQHRAHADLVKVRGAADDLRNAAGAARRGAEELVHARANVLKAIVAAQNARLVVGENLSVTVALTGRSASEQARQLASAQQRADEIAARAIELSKLDKHVAATIGAATAPLNEVQFSESPIQLVDNRIVKEGPPTPVPGTPDDPGGKTNGPSGAEIRSVIMQLPRGDRPWIREVRTPQDLQNLWRWIRQDGAEIRSGYGGDPAKGIRFELPDGTQVGQRFAAESTAKPVLDVKILGEERDLKVHINPTTGGVPVIPSGATAPIVEAPPKPTVAIEAPQMRGSGPVGAIMPDGTLPHLVHPPQAGDPDLPVVGDGIPDRRGQ